MRRFPIYPTAVASRGRLRPRPGEETFWSASLWLDASLDLGRAWATQCRICRKKVDSDRVDLGGEQEQVHDDEAVTKQSHVQRRSKHQHIQLR
jgi:hypothetical protein